MQQMSSSLVRAAGDTAVPHLIEVIFPRLKVPEPLARLGQTCRRIVFVSDPARGSLQRQIVTTQRSQDQPLTDSRDKEFVYFGVVASAAPVDSISFHLRQASHNQSVLGLLPDSLDRLLRTRHTIHQIFRTQRTYAVDFQENMLQVRILCLYQSLNPVDC